MFAAVMVYERKKYEFENGNTNSPGRRGCTFFAWAFYDVTSVCWFFTYSISTVSSDLVIKYDNL
jgi:hypothetical protein